MTNMSKVLAQSALANYLSDRQEALAKLQEARTNAADDVVRWDAEIVLLQAEIADIKSAETTVNLIP